MPMPIAGISPSPFPSDMERIVSWVPEDQPASSREFIRPSA